MQKIKVDTPDFRVVRSGRTHNIKWISHSIDPRAYSDIVRWVRDSNDYSPTTSDTLISIGKLTAQVNKKYGSEISVDQATSIRHIILKDKIIRGYGRMNIRMAKMAAEYDRSSGDILALSAKYDFPPLNLLRGIFLHKNMPSGSIYSVFANKEDPAKLLSGRDLQQYHSAERNDAESTFNQRLVASIADENERAVTEYFRTLDIDLVDQDHLVEEQTKLYGRAVLTPDILFVDPVVINGVSIKWIDYKDYIGTSTSFLYKSNSAQAAKYHAKWGMGALCFHRSFVSNLNIPGAILVDARSLPINLRTLT